MLSKIFDEINFTRVEFGEDANLMFEYLTRGLKTKEVMNLFIGVIPINKVDVMIIEMVNIMIRNTKTSRLLG